MRLSLIVSLLIVFIVAAAQAQEKNPDRNAYFGETHLHTSWSADAWLLGDRLTTPVDSYKYMKGQPIKSPAGFDIKIDTPLDFAGVTDHSEYVGVVAFANDPSSPIGPHIKVRFFGGWSYDKDILSAQDWVHRSYANGVPMGGDLPSIPATKGAAPTFVLWAVKDPTSGNLDRIQVVKGWTKQGQSFEKVFDVVWSGDRKADKFSGRVPPIPSTVDVEKGTYTNDQGSTELKAVWSDPEFDASLHAFYYARVLEIPTPRWTTIQAAELHMAPPDVVAATVQELTSP